MLLIWYVKKKETSSVEIAFQSISLLILDSSASALLNQLIEEEHELIEKAQKTLAAAKTFLADMKANENELTSETPETSTGKVFTDM